MKKITPLLFACFISSGMILHAQSSFTETLVVDISGVESMDGLGSANNTILSILLDGLATRTDCEDSVLELTGLAWQTDQTTVGASWLSEMRIGSDANQDGTAEINLTPGTNANSAGNGVYTSGGILNFVDIGLPNSLITNGVSGSVNFEFFETYDDFAGSADGIFNAGSTLTLQYRLSCSNTLSIDESQDLGSFAMYPNIVKNVVTFSNPKSLALQHAQIYDFSGKLIQTIDLSNMGLTKTFDVSTLATAIYIVKIQTDSGNIVKRLIKD